MSVTRYAPVQRSMLRGLVNYLRKIHEETRFCNFDHGTGRVEGRAVRDELALLDKFITELRAAQSRKPPEAGALEQ